MGESLRGLHLLTHSWFSSFISARLGTESRTSHVKSLAMSHAPTLSCNLKTLYPTPTMAKDRVKNIDTGSDYKITKLEKEP